MSDERSLMVSSLPKITPVIDRFPSVPVETYVLRTFNRERCLVLFDPDTGLKSKQLSVQVRAKRGSESGVELDEDE